MYLEEAVLRLAPGRGFYTPDGTYESLVMSDGGSKPSEASVNAMIATITAEASAEATVDADLRTRLNQASTVADKLEANTATAAEQRMALALLLKLVVKLFRRGVLKL